MIQTEDTVDENYSEGTLSGEFLDSLRSGYWMDTGDRARHNAITNVGIDALALNREILRGEDGHFSHKITSKGITNQKASGRCWMFAGFNTMRPRLIHTLGVEGFEFSAAYLLFWDKMEKSNLYLEQVIELRESDWLDREWQLINEWMVGDGGWWNYVAALIGKFGVVPTSVMPETHSSENTRTMNLVLDRLLRSRAVNLLEASQTGSSLEKLREIKHKAMAEVYRFLVLNLGVPPQEFEWRYEREKTEGENERTGPDDPKNEPEVRQERLSDLKRYTPQSFFQEMLGVDLSQFVALYHDPAKPTGGHYRFSRARNMVGEPEMHFVNVEIEELKAIAVKSIMANQPLWFAVNMRVDQSKDHGLMESELHDYEALFGIQMPLTKANRSRFHAGASNHAMVLMGVDLQEGKPRKWLVENSWGDQQGRQGTWTLYDKWFDEHVYNVIAHKDYVPAETLALFEEEPETLPTWYPGAMGIPDTIARK